MDLESLNSQIVALRDGDEAVGCALGELDSRLERWLGALRAGQTVVVDAWRQLAEVREAAGAAIESMSASETPAIPAEVAKAEATALMKSETTEIAEVDLPAVEETPTPPVCVPPTTIKVEATGVPEPAPEVDAAADVVESTAKKPEAGSSRGMFKKSKVVPDEPTPVDEPSPSADGIRPGSPEDDEALLATLDEQTLAAIRVKRRLGGTRRSVRELLEEIQCEKPAVKDKPQQRKSWWR